MNPQIVTLDPPQTSILTRKILSHDDFICTLLTLAPSEEMIVGDEQNLQEHVLFVMDGEVTVQSGELHTLLGKEDALHLRAQSRHVVMAHPEGWAKLLRVDIPARQTVTPQILSFPS